MWKPGVIDKSSVTQDRGTKRLPDPLPVGKNGFKGGGPQGAKGGSFLRRTDSSQFGIADGGSQDETGAAEAAAAAAAAEYYNAVMSGNFGNFSGFEGGFEVDPNGNFTWNQAGGCGSGAKGAAAGFSQAEGDPTGADGSITGFEAMTGGCEMMGMDMTGSGFDTTGMTGFDMTSAGGWDMMGYDMMSGGNYDMMSFNGGWAKGKGKAGRGSKGGKDSKGCSKGKASQRVQNGETIYSGRVRMFNLEKKHGYIVSQAAFAECGQEVYCFHDVLARGKAGVGDIVAFFVHWSSRGQPQASSPLIRLSAGDEAFALKGTYKPGNDTDKGFGFIQCDETKEFFGRDVYVNKDLAQDLSAGQLVAFNCWLNRDGMPNAKALLPCEESWEPAPGDLSASAEAADVDGMGAVAKGKGGKWGPAAPAAEPSWDAWGWFSGKGCGADGGKSGKAKGNKGGGKKPGSVSGKPAPTGRSCVGKIKSFNQANNYGFITCDEVKEEFGNDVFVHGVELAGYNVGDAVCFELAMSTKGQPQALNVTSPDLMGVLGHVEPPAAKRARFGASPEEMAASDGPLGFDWSAATLNNLVAGSAVDQAILHSLGGGVTSVEAADL